GHRPVFKHRYHDHPRAVVAADDPLGDLKPADARQVEVAQHDIRLEPPDVGQCVLATIGFPDDLDVILACEDHAQSRAHECMVVDHVDPYGHSLYPFDNPPRVRLAAAVTRRKRTGVTKSRKLFGRSGIWAYRLADGVGFEPTNGFPLPVFKTGAFNHSATHPLS